MEAILGRGATAATPEAAERVRHAARIVQYARAAAMSSRVVVLTEALARKYYPPGDAGDIRCWRTAFGFGQGTGALALMLAATYRDDTHRRYSNQSRDPFRAMLLAEDTAVEALRHAYTSSAATAWKAAEKIGEAWDSATRTDVLLRHRHLLDGSVVRAHPTSAGLDRVDAALSLPVRIKKGKVVVMPDDDHSADLGYAALTGLSMTGDDLTGSFAEQRGRDPVVLDAPGRGRSEHQRAGHPGTVPGQHPAGVRRAVGDPVHFAARRRAGSAAPPGPAGRGARRTRLNPAETAAPLLIKSTSCSTSPPTGVNLDNLWSSTQFQYPHQSRDRIPRCRPDRRSSARFCQHSRS